MISSTGENLSILISCNYTACDNWMSFLCWYSINKNLPNAKVLIACNRTPMRSRLFGWTQKCKVPFELHKTTGKEGQIQLALDKKLISAPALILQPDTVALRDFEESGFDVQLLEDKIFQADFYEPQNNLQEDLPPDLCCDVKQEKPCTFVTYSNGWGKFVTSYWIHKLSCPFTSDNRFGHGHLTTNEVRLGQLWRSVTPLFQTVSRG